MVEQKMSGIACYCFPLQTKQPFSHHVLAGCHNEPFRVINTRVFIHNIQALVLYKHGYLAVVCILDVLKCCSANPSTAIIVNSLKGNSSKVFVVNVEVCIKMPSCNSWTPLAWEKMFTRSEFLITVTQVLLGIWGETFQACLAFILFLPFCFLCMWTFCHGLNCATNKCWPLFVKFVYFAPLPRGDAFTFPPTSCFSQHTIEPELFSVIKLIFLIYYEV